MEAIKTLDSKCRGGRRRSPTRCNVPNCWSGQLVDSGAAGAVVGVSEVKVSSFVDAEPTAALYISLQHSLLLEHNIDLRSKIFC